MTVRALGRHCYYYFAVCWYGHGTVICYNKILYFGINILGRDHASLRNSKHMWLACRIINFYFDPVRHIHLNVRKKLMRFLVVLCYFALTFGLLLGFNFTISTLHHFKGP